MAPWMMVEFSVLPEAQVDHLRAVRDGAESIACETMADVAGAVRAQTHRSGMTFARQERPAR